MYESYFYPEDPWLSHRYMPALLGSWIAEISSLNSQRSTLNSSRLIRYQRREYSRTNQHPFEDKEVEALARAKL